MRLFNRVLILYVLMTLIGCSFQIDIIEKKIDDTVYINFTREAGKIYQLYAVNRLKSTLKKAYFITDRIHSITIEQGIYDIILYEISPKNSSSYMITGFTFTEGFDSSLCYLMPEHFEKISPSFFYSSVSDDASDLLCAYIGNLNKFFYINSVSVKSSAGSARAVAFRINEDHIITDLPYSSDNHYCNISFSVKSRFDKQLCLDNNILISTTYIENIAIH